MVCKAGNLLCLLQLFLSERVVIQYVGAPVCPVPAAHGNSRTDQTGCKIVHAVVSCTDDEKSFMESLFDDEVEFCNAIPMRPMGPVVSRMPI